MKLDIKKSKKNGIRKIYKRKRGNRKVKIINVSSFKNTPEIDDQHFQPPTRGIRKESYMSIIIILKIFHILGSNHSAHTLIKKLVYVLEHFSKI